MIWIMRLGSLHEKIPQFKLKTNQILKDEIKKE
jgi:hypothetical protein